MAADKTRRIGFVFQDPILTPWASVFDYFFFSSRRPHTRSLRDWSSDVCSSDLQQWSCPAMRFAPALPDCSSRAKRLLLSLLTDLLRRLPLHRGCRCSRPRPRESTPCASSSPAHRALPEL